MKKLLMIFALAFASPALADDPAPTLTVGDCLTALAGLNALDGRQVVVGQQVVVQPYEFGNAALRKAIQRDQAILRNVQEDQQKMQQSIFREVSKGSAEIKPGSAEFDEYNRQVADSLKLPCGGALVRINIDDLKLDKNEIPGSALGALDKILVK